jgi:hypothetical protein
MPFETDGAELAEPAIVADHTGVQEPPSDSQAAMSKAKRLLPAVT